MAKPTPGPGGKQPAASRLRDRMLMAGVLLLCGMGALAMHMLKGAHSGEGASPVPKALLTKSESNQQQQQAALTPAQLKLVAKALDPTTMQHSVPEGKAMEPGYKNPCWKAEGDKMRCLPGVYLMGSFQSGVNTMFAKLSEHPDVVTNDAARWQFWGEEGKPMPEFMDKHSNDKTLKQLAEAPSKRIILDGSASTFAFYWSAGLRAHRAFQSVMVPCWRECSEGSKGKPEVLRQCTAEKCYTRAMAADVKVAEGLGVSYDTLHMPLIMAATYTPAHLPKLLLLLRNPIDRVHCAYWQYAHYNGKHGKTAEGFLSYVKEQLGVLKSCAHRMTGKVGGDGKPMSAAAAERHCALYFEALGNTEEVLFFHADQLLRGLYSIYLEVWLRHFPRENLLVVKSEDYYADNQAALDKVYTFLGLDKPTSEKVQNTILKAGKPDPCISSAPKMLPEARKLLLDLYRPYNVALADLLKDPSWLQFNQL